MPPKRTLPNPDQATPEELFIARKCAPTQRSSERLYAIQQLLAGIDFEVLAKMNFITIRTLQRWVSAWNQKGIDGLTEGVRPGRPRAFEPENIATITELLDDPAKAGEVHWTARKLHGYLRLELMIERGYSTLTRTIREQGYRRKVPRPMPDKGDPELRKAFCNTLEQLMGDAEVELWFQDESGFEGDPRPRKRWMKIGSKGSVPRNGWHLRMNASGIVCPRTGEAFICEFTHSDTDSFQAFLDEAHRCLELSDKRQIMILDNATWHKSKCIEWGRFEPLYLPPYSPDLNPIERLWQAIKNEWFTDFIAKSQEQLIDRLDKALLWAINRKENNRKTCRIATLI